MVENRENKMIMLIILFTLNFVLESGAGTEGRQEGNEFLEVQSVQHPQQTLQCYKC